MTDLVGQYADRVLAELTKSDTPLTVPELVRVTKLGERSVRMGIDRLVHVMGKVSVSNRQRPGRRGAWPRVYSISKN